MPYSAKKESMACTYSRAVLDLIMHFSNRFMAHYIKPENTNLLPKSVNEKTSMAFSRAYKKTKKAGHRFDHVHKLVYVIQIRSEKKNHHLS